MVSKELLKLIITVLKSWQVLAVSGVVVVYIMIVSSVARLDRPVKRREPKIKKSKIAKAMKKAKEEEEKKEAEIDVTDDDEV